MLPAEPVKPAMSLTTKSLDIRVRVDVEVLVHLPPIVKATTTEPATTKPTNEAGEESKVSKVTEAIIITAKDATEEVLVQVLIVVDVLVDVLVVIVIEITIIEATTAAAESAPLTKAPLVFEETIVLECNVVVNVEVGIVVVTETKAIQASAQDFAPVTPSPVAPVSKEAVEPTKIGHQVLVGVDILVDVLVVVIVEITTVIEAAAEATETAEVTLRFPAEAAEARETTETAAAAARRLGLVFVYVSVVIDVLINIVLESILNGIKSLVDCIRQTSRITSPECTLLRLLNDGEALACRGTLENSPLPGLETGRKHETVTAGGIGNELDVGKVREIVGAPAVWDKLLDGPVDSLDADDFLLVGGELVCCITE